MLMVQVSALLLFVSFSLSEGAASVDTDRDKLAYGHFADDFLWGASTAAYQIEGGWDADGKGPSMWDYIFHNPLINKYFGKGQNADVTCDSYHNYKEDVQMLKKMGATAYRFSLSWPRILPKGTKTPVNQAGIQYYNNLINELIKNDIVPMVTLYHWDLPQTFLGIGGWMNKTMVDYFNDYAEICFKSFGDRVKLWFTINEPAVIAATHTSLVLLNNTIPAYILSSKQYLTVHHLILAHAKVYRTYTDNYKPTQKGKISLVLNGGYGIPLTDSKADKDAADRYMEFYLGIFAEPIFGSGDYPESVRRLVANKSAAVGIASRLPKFSDAEKSMVRGSHDFFAVNHYHSDLVANMDYYNGTNTPQAMATDGNYKLSSDPSWKTTGGYVWPVTPWGMRLFLKYIKDHYGNPDVYVTENGCVVPGENSMTKEERLKDDFRIDFHKRYINEGLKAYKMDGVKLKGYMAWALMDNFEWYNYNKPFGLYYVDFTDANRTRTPKKSVSFFKKLIEDNGFPHSASPNTLAFSPTRYVYLVVFFWAVLHGV